MDNAVEPSNSDVDWKQWFEGTPIPAVPSTSNEENFFFSLPLSPPTTVSSPDISSELQTPVPQAASPVSHSSDTESGYLTGQYQCSFSKSDHELSIRVRNSNSPMPSQPEDDQHDSPARDRSQIAGSKVGAASNNSRRRRPGRPRKEDLHQIHGHPAIRQLHNNSAARSRARFHAVFENLWDLVPAEMRTRSISEGETIRKGGSRAEKGEIILEYLRDLQGKAG